MPDEPASFELLPVDQLESKPSGKMIETGIVFGREPDTVFLRFSWPNQPPLTILLREDEALTTAQALIAATLGVMAEEAVEEEADDQRLHSPECWKNISLRELGVGGPLASCSCGIEP